MLGEVRSYNIRRYWDTDKNIGFSNGECQHFTLPKCTNKFTQTLHNNFSAYNN